MIEQCADCGGLHADDDECELIELDDATVDAIQEQLNERTH